MLPSVKNSRKTRYPSGSPARASEDAQIWVEWQKQLTAYVAWVNSQLKKKPGAHLVEDLRHDVRDGVALIDLIHIIANEEIQGVHFAPSTYAQMKENVDKVLQFMTSHKIKMHHITTRDIVEGNLKAIMRLVLALAAHYKPNSVRHSSQANRQNIAGIAQGAAAALTEARRNATRAGHRYRRRRQREDSVEAHCSDSDHSQNCGSAHKKSASSTHLHQGSHQHHHYHHLHRHHHHPTEHQVIGEGESLKIDGRAELEGASASSSPVSSQNASPRTSLYLSDPSSSMEGLLTIAASNKGNVMVTSCESDAMVDSGYNEILDSIKDTHQMLFQLHDLLLNCDKSNEINDPGLIEISNPKETITILKARVLHSEEMAESLRAENNKIKNECRELNGIKAAIQQRLADQENQLSSVKSELMTLELEKEKLALEFETLKKLFGEREQILSDVRKNFAKQMEDKEKLIVDLRRELLKQEHTVNMINEQNNVDKLGGDQISTDRSSLAELELIKDNFKQAKAQMSFEDPKYAVMCSLEDSLVKLLDKVHINGSLTNMSSGVTQEPGKLNTSVSRPFTSPRIKKTSVSREPFRISQRTPQLQMTTNSSRAQSSPVKKGGVAQQVLARNVMTRPNAALNVISKGIPGKTGKSQIPVLNGGRSKSSSPSFTEAQWTNVIYYTSNSEQPLTCLIRKKLGEIKLRDFKSVIPDSNLYHYFFKALDPEYGSIKEELSNDDDLLPGWEGKIVAWLEEDPGTAC